MVTRILIILFALTLSASAQRICPPNQVNRNGLVGRWLVPGKQTGSVATPTLCLDDSGKGNHGSTVSSPNYGIIFSRPAMTFNGSSQYVSAPNSTSLNFNTSASFSVSSWFKASQNRSSHRIIVNKWTTGASTGSQYAIYLAKTTGQVKGEVASAHQTLDTIITSTNAYDDNNWHNIVFVRNKSTGYLYLYVDGISVATPISDISGDVSNSDPLTIGAFAVYPSYYFNGSIDDVRVYTRVISAAEIRAIYQGEQ